MNALDTAVCVNSKKNRIGKVFRVKQNVVGVILKGCDISCNEVKSHGNRSAHETLS